MFDKDLLILFCWIAEAFALATVVATVVWILRQLGDLPDRLPSHFGITGKPDSWGGRWVVWLMLGIQLFTYVQITLISSTIELITGAPISKPSVLLTMASMKLLLTVTFAFVAWTIVRVGRGHAERLNIAVVFGLAGLMTVTAFLLPRL